ncbi:MAG: YIP1 family protein [Halobacteriota archaeon]
MTTWVRSPRAGRNRGVAGLVRAWIDVIGEPRAFFRDGVTPGDQEAGLTFLVAVTVAYVGGTLLVTPESVIGEGGWVPIVGGSVLLSGVLVVAIAAIFLAPFGLHLVAALQTVVLAATIDDRAGVSETVQVIAYASAPCALAWVPVAPLQVLLVGYGAVLLFVGVSIVHDVSVKTAAVVGAVPAAVVFGWAFGGFEAATALGAAIGL